MASSLKELVQNGINDWLIDWLMMLAVGIYLVLISARDKFCIDPWMEVYLVLEEDGTELDDEEYFQSLPDNSRLMLLLPQDIWSPVGPPYTWGFNQTLSGLICFYIARLKEICLDEIQV